MSRNMMVSEHGSWYNSDFDLIYSGLRIAYFAEKTFKEISRAYEAIRAEKAATYLGLEEEIQGDSGEPSPKLIQLLTQRGWVWDADEHLFRPKVQDKPADINGTKTSGLSQLVGLVSGYGG